MKKEIIEGYIQKRKLQEVRYGITNHYAIEIYRNFSAGNKDIEIKARITIEEIE